MAQDEHEMLVEYSEMTAFNFNSKEYLEVKQDFLECKTNTKDLVNFFENLVSGFKTKRVST